MVSPVPRKARKAQEKLANDFKTAKEAQARAEFCFLVPQKWVMNGIFSGDIPLHRPYIDLIYGRYLQSIGSCCMAIDTIRSALPSLLQDLPVPSVSADGSVKLGGASVMRCSATSPPAN